METKERVVGLDSFEDLQGLVEVDFPETGNLFSILSVWSSIEEDHQNMLNSKSLKQALEYKAVAKEISQDPRFGSQSKQADFYVKLANKVESLKLAIEKKYNEKSLEDNAEDGIVELYCLKCYFKSYCAVLIGLYDVSIQPVN